MMLRIIYQLFFLATKYCLVLCLAIKLYDAVSQNFFSLNLINMGHLYLISAKMKSKDTSHSP